MSSALGAREMLGFVFFDKSYLDSVFDYDGEEVIGAKSHGCRVER